MCSHLRQITTGISAQVFPTPSVYSRQKETDIASSTRPGGGEKNEKWLCGRFRGRETQPLRAITLFECARLHGPSAGFSRKTSRSFFSITRRPLQSSTEIQSTSSSPRKAETYSLVAKILTSELKGIHTRNCCSL